MSKVWAVGSTPDASVMIAPRRPPRTPYSVASGICDGELEASDRRSASRPAMRYLFSTHSLPTKRALAEDSRAPLPPYTQGQSRYLGTTTRTQRYPNGRRKHWCSWDSTGEPLAALLLSRGRRARHPKWPCNIGAHGTGADQQCLLHLAARPFPHYRMVRSIVAFTFEMKEASKQHDKFGEPCFPLWWDNTQSSNVKASRRQ